MMMESQNSEDLNINNEKWKQMLAADNDPSYEENKDFSVELRERRSINKIYNGSNIEVDNQDSDE